MSSESAADRPAPPHTTPPQSTPAGPSHHDPGPQQAQREWNTPQRQRMTPPTDPWCT